MLLPGAHQMWPNLWGFLSMWLDDGVLAMPLPPITKNFHLLFSPVCRVQAVRNIFTITLLCRWRMQVLPKRPDGVKQESVVQPAGVPTSSKNAPAPQITSKTRPGQRAVSTFIYLTPIIKSCSREQQARYAPP